MLLALSLGLPGSLALLDVVSTGLVVLVAAAELAVGEPFPRRRERLFFALFCAAVVELGGEVGVLGSGASVLEAALSVVLGIP